MKTQIGTATTGDFEDNTMTFEIEGDMTLCAGKYAIVPIEDYEKIVKNNEVLDLVSKCDCPHLVACEICGEEKNLDGDFWKNKKNNVC